jgi:hypothetical protein
VTSGGALVRLVCLHGRSTWWSVNGAATPLRPHTAPPWHLLDRFDTQPVLACRLPPPEDCWHCAKARHPPCVAHGGLATADRDRERGRIRSQARPERAASRPACRGGMTAARVKPKIVRTDLSPMRAHHPVNLGALTSGVLAASSSTASSDIVLPWGIADDLRAGPWNPRPG